MLWSDDFTFETSETRNLHHLGGTLQIFATMLLVHIRIFGSINYVNGSKESSCLDEWC